MRIFEIFPIKITATFNTKKAIGVLLIGKEQFDIVDSLKDGNAYRAYAYRDSFGNISSVMLKDYPKVRLPAKIFDIS